MEDERLIELINRSTTLQALYEQKVMSRHELQNRLGISRSTIHRVIHSLLENGVIERIDGDFTLTAFGKISARKVKEFETNIETAVELAPVLETIEKHDIDLDISDFTTATVTRAEPGNPYRGVNRFMSLVEETDTLRGLDPASINPLHIDTLNDRIIDGMVTEAVYPPDVVENLLSTYPEKAKEVFESGNLTLWMHDNIPFGITLCDDRIGIGIYDDNTGMLKLFVDTDDPEAREWAESVYHSYRAEATQVEQ
ncbi:helix-turn-helix transcriptional regulator [Haladaptatus sp. CMAA 1911]|uniref:helix-turn-helix transcriptional regulator n=1 Tax=unclassified Haladaptatus TaxID=2622732 RepID=UPI0037548314